MATFLPDLNTLEQIFHSAKTFLRETVTFLFSFVLFEKSYVVKNIHCVCVV